MDSESYVTELVGGWVEWSRVVNEVAVLCDIPRICRVSPHVESVDSSSFLPIVN